jgi:DNA-binding transcriptional ArsR family regulator
LPAASLDLDRSTFDRHLTASYARGSTPAICFRCYVKKNWTFLSNHAFVLLWIAREPDLRVSDLAREVGISERATYGILADLCEAGYLTRSREGRRARYRIDAAAPMRATLLERRRLAELIALVADDPH